MIRDGGPTVCLNSVTLRVNFLICRRQGSVRRRAGASVQLPGGSPAISRTLPADGDSLGHPGPVPSVPWAATVPVLMKCGPAPTVSAAFRDGLR